jgi:hypothetical protein
VPFPEPYAGLVIRYSYLWKREHKAGFEEGTKDRPCAVVMAIMDQDSTAGKSWAALSISRNDATATPLPWPTKAQSWHTQSELVTIVAQLR